MKKKFTTTIDENLIKAIKLYCIKKDISVSEFFEGKIIETLAEEDDV